MTDQLRIISEAEAAFRKEQAPVLDGEAFTEKTVITALIYNRVLLADEEQQHSEIDKFMLEGKIEYLRNLLSKSAA